MKPAKVRRLGATHKGKSYKVSWFIVSRLWIRLTYLNTKVPERMHHILGEITRVDAVVLQIRGRKWNEQLSVFVVSGNKQIPAKQINKTSRHDKGRDDAHFSVCFASGRSYSSPAAYRHEKLLKKSVAWKKLLEGNGRVGSVNVINGSSPF